MKLGIVGLPNVGKSTLFNSLTQAGAESANYPFCTIDPNIGVVAVPDERLKVLSQLYHSERVVPAVIEFVDIAGLVKGASKGEGLGNQFLAHIREVEAIVHVVRCFEDSNIVHVEATLDPLRDMEVIDLELIYADLDTIERRLSKAIKNAKTDKGLLPEIALLEKLQNELNQGKCARQIALNSEEAACLKSFHLLSAKPVLYAVNVGEVDLSQEGQGNPYVEQVKARAATEGSSVFVVCAKIEEEIAQLEEEEKRLFLQDLGLEKSGLQRLIAAGYEQLGLISFLTAGPKETRAWTIPNGLKAPQAAGKIHTDFERGFIRAEIVSYSDLIRLGSYQAAKESGLVRSEGKEYVIKEDDVVLFRFNV